MLAVAGVFLYSMASIGMTLYRYYISDKSYDDTAEQFTALATGAEDAAGGTDGAAYSASAANMEPFFMWCP